MKKTQTCKQCKALFSINFKDDYGKYHCLSNRKYCLSCRPQRKKINKNVVEQIIKEYPKDGAEIIINKYRITKNQLIYIAAKNGLKIKRETLSSIYSNSKTKKNPKDYKVNHEQFININNTITPYILGLIWTDGHINKKTNAITFSTTPPDSEEFSKAFLKTGEWNIYQYKTKNNWKDRGTIETANKFLKDFLTLYDFSNKEIGFGKIYSFIPDDYKPAFLMGVIDGDGSFFFYPKVGNYSCSICSCYNQNWDTLKQICENLGIKYMIRLEKGKNGSSSKFHVGGKRNAEKFGNFIYNNNNFGLKRKYENYLRIKSTCK